MQRVSDLSHLHGGRESHSRHPRLPGAAGSRWNSALVTPPRLARVVDVKAVKPSQISHRRARAAALWWLAILGVGCLLDLERLLGTPVEAYVRALLGQRGLQGAGSAHPAVGRTIVAKVAVVGLVVELVVSGMLGPAERAPRPAAQRSCPSRAFLSCHAAPPAQGAI